MEKSFKDQFNDCVKSIEKEWCIVKEDLCKNIVHKNLRTAHITQILGEHSKNVGQILCKIKGRVITTGTCFLLTGSLGLTCYHVVKYTWLSPGYSFEITFNYTEMGTETRYVSADIELFCEKNNFAFLRLKVSPYPGCPGGLLPYLALPPQDGAVAIIGHPQRQCKQIEFCSVINLHNHKDSRHPSFVYVLTMYNFLKMFSNLVTNTPRLYDGASGAPVFNECGELVAMHSGGYMVNTSDTDKPEIEYGRSIVEIVMMGAEEIEDLRHQLYQLLQRNEALQSYMCSEHHGPYMKKVIRYLRKLWKIDVKHCTEKMVTKPKSSQQADCEMEPTLISQQMEVLNYSKWKPKNESENKKKEKPTQSPLTLLITLSLKFEIPHEDASRNMLTGCSHFISREASNLGNFLSPRLYNTMTDKPPKLGKRGCYRCPRENCKVCKWMKEGGTFDSYSKEKPHNIRHLIDCNSIYVVYLISCTPCKVQYVGCTTGKLKQRIRKHMSDASNPNVKTLSMVSRHFLTVHDGDLDNFQFQGIQTIDNPLDPKTGRRILNNEETFWIWNLNTIYPNGLNLRSKFAHKY